jgi:PEP-CTERM motif
MYEFATKILRRWGSVVPFLALSLLCTEAKSDTVTLSYKVRIDTAECSFGIPCPIPFTQFLETFTVTFDPLVPIVDATTVGLDIISINRPYSSAFTYSITQRTDDELGTLTIGTNPEANDTCGNVFEPNTYCTQVNVNPLSPHPPMHSLGLLETTATGEIWQGQNVIPEPSTWLMVVLGFAGLSFAARRQGEKTSALRRRREAYSR